MTESDNPGAWEEAFDETHQRAYWYNRKTGTSTWEQPPVGDIFTNNEGKSAAFGYYYRDAYGTPSGPFTLDTLRIWRDALPMDLQVWHHAAESVSLEESEKKTKVCLADVLGDMVLLDKWRRENDDSWSKDNSTRACCAPSAAEYERERGAERKAVGQSKSALTEYAQAVLAGLPADDEDVSLAKIAAQSGQSLSEIASMTREEVDYSITVHHSKGQGKIQALTKDESVYKEFDRWLDPKQVEMQLSKASQQRKKKRGVSREDLERIKERKLEVKKKKNSWLYT